jgi:hypothetical protein
LLLCPQTLSAPCMAGEHPAVGGAPHRQIPRRVGGKGDRLPSPLSSSSPPPPFPLPGIDTENLTLLMPPYQEDLIGPGNLDQEGSGGTQVHTAAPPAPPAPPLPGPPPAAPRCLLPPEI